MKNSCWIAIFTAASALAAILLDSSATRRQAPANDEKAKAKAAAKAKQNAKNFENNARVDHVLRSPRQDGGHGRMSESLYDETVLSPDRTRVAVVKEDQEAENADLWILGCGYPPAKAHGSPPAQRMSSCRRWSGRRMAVKVAYVEIRGGSEGLYRRASNGEGARGSSVQESRRFFESLGLVLGWTFSQLCQIGF